MIVKYENLFETEFFHALWESGNKLMYIKEFWNSFYGKKYEYQVLNGLFGQMHEFGLHIEYKVSLIQSLFGSTGDLLFIR